VANRKIILVKFPARLEFENSASDISFLPVVMITYGRTWLYAIVYYAGNFEINCFVVNELRRDNASFVAILQEIFNDSNELKALKADLDYIHANISFLSQFVTELEKTLNLSETIKEIYICKQQNHCLRSCCNKTKILLVVW
jgi:hypothetical protein